jgi:hypothetical protein
MTLDEECWTALESQHTSHGFAARRLFPASAHDLFVMVRHPGQQRVFAVRTDTAAAESALRTLGGRFPQTHGMTLEFVALPDGHRELQLTLTEPEFREVFTPLVNDIADAAQKEETPVGVLHATVARFERWRHLLRSVSDGGLDAESRRGLYGELALLQNHVLPALGDLCGVMAWTGPMSANQDFQTEHVAVEVKTSCAKRPSSIIISNERELDDRGASHLVLAFLLLDERRGGTGESLNTLVDNLRTSLAQPAARSGFDQLLLRVGYLPYQRHLYDEPRYTLRQEMLWQVTGEFPRITEQELRTGVGDCRYRISTSGLDQYRLESNELDGLIGVRP